MMSYDVLKNIWQCRAKMPPYLWMSRINEFLSEWIEEAIPLPFLPPWLDWETGWWVCVWWVCTGGGPWATLKHNATALELIQQLCVSQDHTMMPVVPLASPLSGTTVCVHKFEWEQGSLACGPSWARGWPLNTPANFSSLVHAATGGAMGASSALQRAAVGSPNCSVKG